MTEVTPAEADATADDHLIEPSDNSGEPGMPEVDQDPTHLPEGTVS